MRKSLILLIVGLVLIGLISTTLILGLIGLMVTLEEESYMEEEKPKEEYEAYKIEDYWVTLGGGEISYLKVKLKGKASNLLVMLSDPEGITVDKKYVSEENLLDGVETVELRMISPFTTKQPKAGTYTIIIVDTFGKQLYLKKTIRFGGGRVKIKEIKFNVEGVSARGLVIWINMILVNDGDLPICVTKAIVEVNGKKKEIFLYEWIPPGKDKKIIKRSSIPLGERPLAKITLYSGDVIVGTCNVTFDITGLEHLMRK